MPRRFSSSAPLVAGLGFGTAVGVLVGSFLLHPVLGQVGGGDDAVREEYKRTVQNNQVIEAQTRSGDAVFNDLAPLTVDGTLAQRPVILIKTAAAQPADVAGVEALLKSADITNAGVIELSDNFFKPEQADTLKSLVANTLPAGAKLSTKDLDAGTHAGQAMAAALMLDAQSTNPLATVEERATLMRALRDKKLINYADGTLVPAQAVIIIDGRIDGSGDSAHVARSTAAFVSGFDSVGHSTVFAAQIEETAAAGAMGIVRSQQDNQASTVDSIDRPWAQMAAVLAVREQLDGRFGAYGAAADVDAAAPALPEA